jgi:multicomponent Na+:H+ antiporter subunit B
MINNNMSTLIFLIFLVIILLKFIFTKKIINIVVLASSFSLISCLIYLDLSAPDVAITEAAIGVSLGGIMTIISLSYNKTNEMKYSLAKIVMISLLILISIFLTIKIASFFPEFGLTYKFSPYQVFDYYINNTKEQIGINSISTAILADYRAFDTFLETLVMLIVLIGAMKTSPIIEIPNFSTDFFQQKTIQFIFPIIFILSFYILLNGKETPGGGFQFGAMIASIIILYFLVKKKNIININGNIFLYLGIVGVLMYLITGMYSMLLGYNIFTFDAYGINQNIAHQKAIFIIEIGIGISIAAVCILLVMTIFSNFRKIKTKLI